MGGVLCLHGLGRAASDWDGVRAGLAAFGVVCAPELSRANADAEAAARAAAEPGAVLVGHSMGALLALRLAADPALVPRAVVLTGGFFPPARNGRGAPATVADYARHRVAFVREALGRPREAGPRRGTAGALGSLVRLAARPAAFEALTSAVTAPVLVIHARDDHHVPVDFALAARRPSWDLHVFEHGGHHLHADRPGEWLEVVGPWLGRVRDLAVRRGRRG